MALEVTGLRDCCAPPRMASPSPRACDCVVQTVVLGRFPLARAGDSYSDELRLLDLELEILSLKSQMLFALTSRDRCTAPRSHT